MDDFLNEEVESVLHIAREVSVYKIPPLKANEGHRAGEWGDLAAPLWKGRMRIIEKSSGVTIHFEDATTGELFAKTEYDPGRPSVEAVLDSSRYFVVRVEDAGKKAYIGMGFAERTDSFDFNVALQDYTKRWKTAQNPSTPEDSESTPSPHVPAGPKKDYSLKEGQTFSINIPGRKKATENAPTTGITDLLDSSSSSTSSSGATGGAIPLLPPPPSGGGRRK
ncbi:adaptin ear-binding coat-associated protein 1 NECAP-1 [Dendrothele bispora CBS 962.96]|uniref:Adaptin ear-binding coat-associated protein 1 NECAP-1 n=1 Tax=Dendrothele bispora (strain CBS 962.96) TaxID=1314807 RepID=A0A4S8MWS2_DENBC|nr:adaptin ear-binding coat-associated protein 1 NECAP-1 [Dendrothele bispora CBS 962.96]